MLGKIVAVILILLLCSFIVWCVIGVVNDIKIRKKKKQVLNDSSSVKKDLENK